jgi:hypothetical protein
MPLQSKAQGRYLNMKFGHDWVKKHHFGGSQKELPEHAQHGKTNVGLALFKAMQNQKKKPSRA